LRGFRTQAFRRRFDGRGLGRYRRGNAPPDWVERQIHALREKTDKPFGLNIMLLSPYVEQVAALAAGLRVPAVITGAGNALRTSAAGRKRAASLRPSSQAARFAMLMERTGADFVIAEGCEAGGHIGELTSMVLWPDIAQSVSIPVVAAGGIFDAGGVVAAFCLGAKGVQVGTRFILAEECTAHEAYKERVMRAKDVDSKVTGRITGHPVRVLRSPLQRELAGAEYGPDGAAAVEALGEGSLMRAVLHGDKARGSFMAGQCACMVNRIQPAEEIVRDLFDAERLKSVLSGASALLEAKEANG
jgi:enoyl-[acyl-carrier protein] reductase II